VTVPASVNSGDSPSVSRSTAHAIVGTVTGKSADVVFPQLRLPVRRGLPPRALQRVREYVETHLEKNISLQSLASTAGLSLSHFARAFKLSEGATPHEYLLQCRVRRAQELLAGTDLPLAEIARACGFSDQSHCTRRFRERFGITPASYRSSMR
jgi:transcriptional regulator GlxA family with amidase domain